MNTNAGSEDRRVIGRYRLLRLLGEGGVARTHLAENVEDGIRYAVKELQLLKTSNPKQIELFERECAILKGLSHPQIPRFIETIVERRSETMSLYLVQELIDGRSLQQILDAGVRFSTHDTVFLLRSALRPLEYLHSRRTPLYHRDLKPSNILLRTNGDAVLIDFGAVREAIADPKAGGSSVVGTFGYMAPEQFQARAYPATDLYGLGATAIQLITGVEPGRFEIRRLKPDFHDAFPDDAHLAAILDLLLEPDVEDRYRNARSLRKALERWVDAHPSDLVERDRLKALVADTLEAEARGDATRPAVVASTPADPPRGSRVQALSAVPPRDESDAQAEPEEQAEPVSDGHGEAPDTAAAALDSTGDDVAAVPDAAPADASAAQDATEVSEAQAATAGQSDVEQDDRPAPTPEQKVEVAQDEPDPSTADAVEDAAAASPPADAATAEVTSVEAAPTDAGASDVPAQQHLEERQSSAAVDIVTRRASAAEPLKPGGQGARAVGIIVAAVGAAGVIYALFGGMEYNAQPVMVIGGLIAAWGLLLALVPRSAGGRASADVRRNGLTTSATALRIVKRIGALGTVEWYVEYEYVGDDGLHHSGTFPLPSARVAQKVARDPSAVAVRYAMHDPSESLLVVRTHAG